MTDEPASASESPEDFLAGLDESDDPEPADRLRQHLNRAIGDLSGDPAPVDAYRNIEEAKRWLDQLEASDDE